jgi:Tfp pilus assembly protein PilW
MRKRSGRTLMEMLVVALLLGVVMGGLSQMAVSLNKINVFSTSMPTVQDDANRIVNLIANDVRSAPLCTTSSGGKVQDSVIDTASSNALTIYTSDAGATRRYSLTSTTFGVSDNGAAAWLTIPNVSSLAIQYCTITDSSYNLATLPADSSWSTSVTGSDRLKIAAIKVSATVTRNGLVGTYSAVVRLRNSPKR